MREEVLRKLGRSVCERASKKWKRPALEGVRPERFERRATYVSAPKSLADSCTTDMRQSLEAAEKVVRWSHRHVTTASVALKDEKRQPSVSHALAEGDQYLRRQAR